MRWHPMQYFGFKFNSLLSERVLNNLYRTRLSRHHVIWWFGSILPHPLPPPPPPSEARPAKHRKTEKERKKCWRGGGGKSQIIRRRESMVLYISFNTLCSPVKEQKVVFFVLEHLHIIMTTTAYHFVTKIRQRMKYFHIDNIDKRRQSVTHRT